MYRLADASAGRNPPALLVIRLARHARRVAVSRARTANGLAVTRPHA
jgi:hypothetical protein